MAAGTTKCVLVISVLLVACGRAHRISAEDMPAFEVSLATFADHMDLAWQGGNEAHSAVYLRRVGADGKAQGGTVQLSDATQDAYEPDLAPAGRDLVVAWYEKDARNRAMTAWVGAVDETGRFRWRHALSPAGANGRNPVVRVWRNQILVAWIETPSGREPYVCTEQLTADGVPVAGPRQAALASNETWNLNAAVDSDGIFYVVYDATLHTRAKELQLLQVRGEAIDIRPLGTDDGFSSVYPDIAIEGRRAAISWVDQRDGRAEVYLFSGSVADLASSFDAKSKRITHSAGESSGAYVAWNRGRLGLAWNHAVDGIVDVWVEQFDEQARATSAPLRLTHHDNKSLIPAIRPWHSGFAVAWNDLNGADVGSVPKAMRSSAAMVVQVDRLD